LRSLLKTLEKKGMVSLEDLGEKGGGLY
jgi:hypothetical protein